jgi:hypothetical protein
MIRTPARYTRSVDETFNHQAWPALHKDDAGLQKELEKLLTSRVQGDPYADDGTFFRKPCLTSFWAQSYGSHTLADISLTLDGLT